MKTTEKKLLSNEEIASFCSQAAMLFQAGIPPVEGMAILQSDAQSPEGKAIFEEILTVCRQGESFHKALEATKVFQPQSDTHTQLNVRATCVAEADGGAIVFINAVQDRYALKSQSSSASVGVSMIGSVSLPVPIGGSTANLVRVGSTTVQNQEFYGRLFDRVAFYLTGTPTDVPPPPEPETPPDPVPQARE